MACFPVRAEWPATAGHSAASLRDSRMVPTPYNLDHIMPIMPIGLTMSWSAVRFCSSLRLA